MNVQGPIEGGRLKERFDYQLLRAKNILNKRIENCIEILTQSDFSLKEANKDLASLNKMKKQIASVDTKSMKGVVNKLKKFAEKVSVIEEKVSMIQEGRELSTSQKGLQDRIEKCFKKIEASHLLSREERESELASLIKMSEAFASKDSKRMASAVKKLEELEARFGLENR